MPISFGNPCQFSYNLVYNKSLDKRTIFVDKSLTYLDNLHLDDRIIMQRPQSAPA